MKVKSFYTANIDSFLNRCILRVAKASLAHVGLLFTAGAEEMEKLKKILPGFYWDTIPLDKDGSYCFFFESIWKKDARTGKTGVRGPYPFTKLAKWKGYDEKRTLEVQDLPLLSEQAFDMIPFLCDAVIAIKYARKQLYFNWKGMRLGRGIPFKQRTPNKWTCIEMVIRTITHVAPKFAVFILKLGEFTYEDFPPSSKNELVPGLFEIIKDYQKDKVK